MPATLTATYRIVTPMFIGDANQSATEITPASVKGALRFWWRALNWGKFRNPEANEEAALRKLHAAEAELFGAAADDKIPGRGQGKFLLRVIPVKKWHLMNDVWPLSGTGSAYLGRGLWEKPHRTALTEGQDFKVQIIFKPMPTDLLENTTSTLINLLTIWGLVGGLGSRARRGFGSVQLLQLSDTPLVLKDVNGWFAALNGVLSLYPMTRTLPPYSAFSEQRKLGYLMPAKDTRSRQSHEKLGNHFKKFRGEPMGGDTKRIFGMPLPGGSPAMAKARRSSPLFFHIVQLGEQQFVPVALSLPTEPFHPVEALNRVDWSIIDDFFAGLSSWKGKAA